MFGNIFFFFQTNDKENYILKKRDKINKNIKIFVHILPDRGVSVEIIFSPPPAMRFGSDDVQPVRAQIAVR